MTIPLHFASLYHGQMWSDCLLDLGTDFHVGNTTIQRSCYQRSYVLLVKATIETVLSLALM